MNQPRRARAAGGILLRVGLLALAYYATAKLGLSQGTMPGNVSPVWPAAGLAVAALFSFGTGLWPGIVLGELAANLGAVKPGVALAMGAGNALASLVAVWLLRQANFRAPAARLRDVVALVGLAALGSTAISASFGSGSLGLSGTVPWSAVPQTWATWWAGDMMGVLLAGAPLMGLAAKTHGPRRSALEGSALLGVVLVFALVVFGWGPSAPYLMFPLVAWAAIRFSTLMTATTSLVAATVAVAHAVDGRGPFATGSPAHSLLVLDVFLGVLAVSGLVLSALVRERDQAELALSHANRHLEARVAERTAALAEQARHDALTGLPNRALLEERLTAGLRRAAAGGGEVAVIFIDLDRFKLVNDSRGHAAGDEVLKAVAVRLRAAVRAGDTVARFGGDEFVVACSGPGVAAEIGRVADRVARAFERPFTLPSVQRAGGSDEVFLTVSLGVALAAGPEATSETLVRDADAAMYEAKDRGRNRCEFFDDGMRMTVEGRLRTQNALHRALERSELTVLYQPVIEVATGTVVGAEALVRWRHPELGLVDPVDFVPMAEDTGLIGPIGEFVIDDAMSRLAGWKRRCPDTGLSVHVNLSVHQLRVAGFVDRVARLLAAHRLDPAGLCLEVTEGTFMADADGCGEALISLRAMGVRLAIDDFGTGYSSLTHLKRYPVDILKIDQSFVAGLDGDGFDRAVVESVIDLAHALGMVPVAEGVETLPQVAALRLLGCERAQGFYFAPPLPPERVASLIAGEGDPSWPALLGV